MEYKHIEDLITREHSREALERYNRTGERPSITGLSRIGKFCYVVMGLDEIAEDDLQRLASRFPHVFKDRV